MLKNCPSCWRPIKFDEKYTRIIACLYCNSILEFWTWELNKIWEQAEFIEFPSIFMVWKEVKWKWKNVFVKWQIRYEYDWWFFDKFFVIIDWNEYYIIEDDGMQNLFINYKIKDFTKTFIDLSVWEIIDLFNLKVFIQELWVFNISFIKWFINNIFIPWRKYEYLYGLMDWIIYFFERDIINNKVYISKWYDLKN